MADILAGVEAKGGNATERVNAVTQFPIIWSNNAQVGYLSSIFASHV